MVPTQYIDRCGEQVFAPPFGARMTNFYCFAVRADHKTLNQNICDRFFNSPLQANGRFTAFQYVFFVFNTIEEACSENDDYKDKGVFSYQEAAIWMLTADHKDERIRWFHPYMFVNDPYAMFAGREIYGFPKTVGTFKIPNGPEPAPQTLYVKTLVVKQNGHRGEQAILFEAGRPPEALGEHCDCESEDNFLAEVFKELNVKGSKYFEDYGLPPDFAASAYNDLSAMRLPIMFIKQFRDGKNPQQYSGQLIFQEAASQLKEFGGSRLFKAPYEIAINDVVSHPIRRDLGLHGPLKAELAFWMTFRFSLGHCKDIT